MREIVLDTETTGLDPKADHRIIEIGCVELERLIPTGRTYHTYINPQRTVPADASRISGITTDFLKDKLLFQDVVEDFLTFIGESPLVIHNASFDMGFINAELSRLNRPLLPLKRAIDTLRLAKQKFPGAPASLDALCRRFGIDLSERSKHGALLDARLLARVYLELNGGRQVKMAFQTVQTHEEKAQMRAQRPFRAPRYFMPTPEELALHETFLMQLKEPLWKADDSEF